MSDTINCQSCQGTNFLVVKCDRCQVYYCFKCWDVQKNKKECLYMKDVKCDAFHSNKCDTCCIREFTNDNEQCMAWDAYLTGLEKAVNDRNKVKEEDVKTNFCDHCGLLDPDCECDCECEECKFNMLSMLEEHKAQGL